MSALASMPKHLAKKLRAPLVPPCLWAVGRHPDYVGGVENLAQLSAAHRLTAIAELQGDLYVLTALPLLQGAEHV